MTRRWMGMALIILAALLVTVLANVLPQLRAGLPQAVPVQGPPSVGDCVVDSFLGASLQQTPGPNSAGALPVYPVQRTQQCDGKRYGEVVAIVEHPLPYVLRGEDEAGRYLEDANADACSEKASSYVGIPDQPLYGFWRTDVQITSGLSGPSDRQRAAGQRWAACIVTVQPRNEPAYPLSAWQYGSALLKAVDTGAERNLLGQCPPVAEWNYNPSSGSCGLPHVLELFGYGFTGDESVDRAQLELTCRQFVGRLTGMTDPTAGGDLATEVHVEDGRNAVITGPQVPARSFLRCGVEVLGVRKLAGSLRALGHAPIPWA